MLTRISYSELSMKPHHLPAPVFQPQHPSPSQFQLHQAAANQDSQKWESLGKKNVSGNGLFRISGGYSGVRGE